MRSRIPAIEIRYFFPSPLLLKRSIGECLSCSGGDGSGIEESTESLQLSFPSFPVLVLPNIRGTQVSRQQRNLESRGSAPPRIAKPNK